MLNSHPFNQFKQGQAPQILKGGVEGRGSFDMVCTECGQKFRLNYRPEGQYKRGIFTCIACQERIKAAVRSKEQSVFSKILNHPDNIDRMERQRKRIEELGPRQNSQVDPQEAQRLKEIAIERNTKLRDRHRLATRRY